MHSSYHCILWQVEFNLSLIELIDIKTQCLLNDKKNNNDLIEEVWLEKIEVT